jgi:acylphosphatase
MYDIDMDEHEFHLYEIHCTVHGTVQGVGYRAYVERIAEELEVFGYVRNCPEETVCVVAQATESALNQFIIFLKAGAANAQVERVDVEWHEDRQLIFSDFSIKYDEQSDSQ